VTVVPGTDGRRHRVMTGQKLEPIDVVSLRSQILLGNTAAYHAMIELPDSTMSERGLLATPSIALGRPDS
jgi:hypothetical protein